MDSMSTTAVGIDIGGTGIKGAVVDVSTGELLSERIKIATPHGGEPDAIVSTVHKLIKKLGGIGKKEPIGVCFPAIVVKGFEEMDRTGSRTTLRKRVEARHPFR
jgi:polyphosphate glucokinase